MSISFVFFFNDTATTEIYTLSLHDALPISNKWSPEHCRILQAPHLSSSRALRASHRAGPGAAGTSNTFRRDRKSTRLNSSHSQISYAAFCLKKKTNRHCRLGPQQ